LKGIRETKSAHLFYHSFWHFFDSILAVLYLIRYG